MPSLPKPSFARVTRGRSVGSPPLAEPEASPVEVVEALGIRWVNVEQPRHSHRAWLEERFDFHALDYEDVFSRNQRPKIDEYEDYLFIVLYFPRFDKQVGRLNAAELDLFVGPDFLVTLPNAPLQPVEYLFERVRANDELREQWFSKGTGYLLYKIVDACVDASFPMLAKMGNKLERIEDEIFEGRSSEVVRDISNVKQEIINFRKVVRPQRAVFGDLERTKQRYLAEDLDVYFDDINDASERVWQILENLQGDGRGAGGDERVGPLARAQRRAAHPDGADRRVPAAHADRLDLRHERACAGPGPPGTVLGAARRDGRHRRRDDRLLQAAPLAVTSTRNARAVPE